MLERMTRLFEHATVTAPIPVSAQFTRAARAVTTVLQRAPRSSAAGHYRALAATIDESLGGNVHVVGHPMVAAAAAVAR